MAKENFSQPEVNIGLIGHVDHGKTTLLKVLSGKWADTHSEELRRGITIRLGYADTTFYKSKEGYNLKEGDKVRTVSFIDAPGHETLMATMLSGAAIMDGALLLIAANEECPQPQTKEHLMALEILGIENVIIVQNKIDLVTKEDAIANYEQIKEFVKGSIAEKAPIVPISALHNVNIDVLIETIEKIIPTPKRDLKKDSLMLIARSFDINKPGSDVRKMIGGVLGGSIIQGMFKVNDEIEIKPGRKVEEKGMVKYVPYITKINGMMTGGKPVEELMPGGSCAILTTLDPSIIKSDQLIGNVVGRPGSLPKLYSELILEPTLLKRVVGSKEELGVDPIKKGEPLMLTINAAATAGVVYELEKNKVKLKLKRPICALEGSKIAISRRIGSRWRLIGYSYL